MARKKDKSKRDKILNATLTLIEEKGIAGIKMTEVATRARLAVGTVYLYFEDKEQLILTLWTEVQMRMRDYFSPHFSGNHFIPRFQTIWRAYMQYCINFPDQMIFLSQIERSPYVGDTTEHPSPAYEIFYQLIEEGKAESLVVEMRTDLLVYQILGVTKEIIENYMLDRLALTSDDFHDIYQLFWRAIRN